MLPVIEQTRLKLSQTTEPAKKSQLGQFLTPARTARFMASLFNHANGNACNFLDAGAGIGSLSSAFLERCLSKELKFDSIRLKACEIDGALLNELNTTLSSYSDKLNISIDIVNNDFIEYAVNCIQFERGHEFTHVILNPPYKKINSDSRHRILLRQVEIETVNLYSAFVALALKMMARGGQLVAIIPRSFCNGPYYRPFREFILKNSAIRYIHLFESRDKAFSDDSVLQENVIIMLEHGGMQENITVSTSTDDTFSDIETYKYPFNEIVFKDDSEVFIHIPVSPDQGALDPLLKFSLEDLGVNVSTGPVVDFRLKDYLREANEADTVPLLYPGHFGEIGIEWPKQGFKKRQAIIRNEQTEKWLYPAGFYCVVRRFSSKEEKRRVVASVVSPTVFPGTPVLGFENHLNVYHKKKHGLPESLALGLACYLNTSAVDNYFRRFSGHTQVNATDLKLIKYPSYQVLMALGAWIKNNNGGLTQAEIDEKLENLNAT